jgi:hypothetical protein
MSESRQVEYEILFRIPDPSVAMLLLDDHYSLFA